MVFPTRLEIPTDLGDRLTGRFDGVVRSMGVSSLCVYAPHISRTFTIDAS
jgi:hypothetical protein